MKLFDRTTDIPIVLETGADEAIRLAAADLQGNLRRLSGQSDGFPILKGTDITRAVFVETQEGNTESYTVCVDEDTVRITGGDILGTVFGIYAFATKCLEILPVYRMIDRFPTVRESMELSAQTFASAPRAIRFRGWFLNDEDLLTDFHPGGGHRTIDYPFYENVMAPEVLDMVLETALRLEINLMIPSSFVDIDNPDEEKLVQAVYRRGMYISQHHVEPVGVSYFAADNFMKARGYENEVVSFISNRERMEEIWRYYIEKWAKYGDRVIWQLGLRGKADRPVWKSDSRVPMDAARRGEIITDAIATQYRIVSEVLGSDAFRSTATLWLEGAELYGKGYLKIPEDTIVVFSDIGSNQMWGDDFYRVPRIPSRHYGVYYHVGFWTEGPHLAEGCDLRKMADACRAAWERGALDYAILNVSNVRPLHFSVWAHAKVTEDPTHAVGTEISEALLNILFGDAADTVAPLMTAYYNTIADLGKDELKTFCQQHEFYFHDYGTPPYPEYPATDGYLRRIGLKILDQKPYTVDDERFARVLSESLNRWEALHARMTSALDLLPEEDHLYFRQFLLFETRYMMHLTRWLLACRTIMQSEDRTVRENACHTAMDALAAILTEREILELDHWQGWHRGDKKIGIANLQSKTMQAYQIRSRS